MSIPEWELQCFPCCSLCGLLPTASHGWQACPGCVWVAGRGMYCFALALNLIGLVAGILLAVMPFSAAAVLGYLAGLYLIVLGVESVAMAFFPL